MTSVVLKMIWVGIPLFLLGICVGAKLSIRVLNRLYFQTLADDAISSAARKATCIHHLLTEEMSSLVFRKYSFPFDHPDVTSHIKNGINLN